MVYKRRKFSRGRKHRKRWTKNTKKYRVRRRTRSKFPRFPRRNKAVNPFPEKKYLDMYYIHSGGTPVGTVAGSAYQVKPFRANDIYDPDPLLGGNYAGPYGSPAQLWASLYNRYKVISARYTLTLYRGSGTNQGSGLNVCKVLAKVDDDNVWDFAGSTNPWQRYMADPDIRFKTWDPAKGPVTVVQYYRTKSRTVSNDDSQTGIIGTSSPLDQSFFLAGIQNVDLSQSYPPLQYEVRLDYKVVLFDRKDVYSATGTGM